ncbi:MAG: 4Fe-4S binding protein [Candidatus Helarchaeota archaeon]
MNEHLVDPKTIIRKTGPETGDYITVDEEKCNGCGKCTIICPVSLYEIVDGKSRLNSEYEKWCLECAHCWVICPNQAISFHYPKGGSGILYEKG